jgi:hypothetical protein
MELTMPNTNADHAKRVLEILRTRCSAAPVCELAIATGLGELEVIDALYELERSGRVTPTVWRLADEPSSPKPPRPAGQG